MTASLLNQIPREISRQSPMKKGLSLARQLNLVKKNLFGPASSAETLKIYNEELKKHQEKATKKWDFDFRNGAPLVSGNVNYIWERVSGADFVPQTYTLSRAAHVRQIQEITSYDLLMDERADRANFPSDDSQDESMELYQVPTTSAASSLIDAGGRSLLPQKPKRQLTITEFMKKRKRLAQTAKKISPSKRARTTSNSSNTSSLSNTLKHFQRTH